MSKPTRSEHAELTAALSKIKDAISKGWVEHSFGGADWFRSTALGNIRIIPPEITVAEAVEAVGRLEKVYGMTHNSRPLILDNDAVEILREWAEQEKAKGVGK